MTAFSLDADSLQELLQRAGELLDNAADAFEGLDAELAFEVDDSGSDGDVQAVLAFELDPAFFEALDHALQTLALDTANLQDLEALVEEGVAGTVALEAVWDEEGATGDVSIDLDWTA